MAYNLLVVVATIIAMEFVAAGVHRFIMHGLGWGWHRSHHEPGHGPFELNDLYGLFFAAAALVLTLLTSSDSTAYWIGIGLTVYGILYFVVHDGLVHQRWPFRHVPRNPYLKRLVQAHRLHHAVAERDGAVSFGFLYAPPVRRLKAELQKRRTPVGGARP